ncbi:hypothetical protein, variant 4 [Exophiala oligosperma]|uniref:Uncharacterized protein n=1 Tax=Exophiala oligosperma TaxID=215243 RepID=A0A0D2CZG1_9EURO|nr:hypothetical protein, variant 2 [Exophiala oligosperma]XP_016256629.1 hypothetical protein, variant 3 [Exophiala oligosperma]XP_016256630.1 hypothetical protein, variant 4 [Exophiala oligosperma]KIW36412.1 hypothetical protein, variant 2 [Exophiala oligosperma]KIW36413.1 hypothetical protein, variant 3 [Exophiala oligosperma]KIW36414.1 hypothetical protein, variant 4 [Exophiala oligosperma]
MSSRPDPIHYARRPLHSSLSVPALLPATSARDLPPSKRPSLPSFSSLMDTVAKQAEKGGSQSLNYDSGQTSGASTDRLYETGNPAIVNPLTPDYGNSATNMPSSAALARGLPSKDCYS